MRKKIKLPQHLVYCQYINDWNKFQILNVEEISRAYYTLFDEDYGLLSFLEQMWMFSKLLNDMVWDDNFSNLFKATQYALNCVNEVKAKSDSYLKQMFNKVNGINIATKFKSFDKEIGAYSCLIKNKQLEIHNKIDVLTNQRKIKLLQEKINHLIDLKKHFISSCKEQSKTDLALFLDKVEKMIVSHKGYESKPSLASTFKTTNKDKMDLLMDFISAHWISIVVYIDNGQTLLTKFKKYMESENELYKKN